jgi:hypothetical protein
MEALARTGRRADRGGPARGLQFELKQQHGSRVGDLGKLFSLRD